MIGAYQRACRCHKRAPIVVSVVNTPLYLTPEGDGLPTTRLERIARRLRRRVDAAAEPTGDASESESMFGVPGVDAVSFRRAMRLKAELQRTFDERSLDDLYKTDELETDYGTCLEIRHREPIELPWPDATECRKRLERTIRLLHGVGPRVEAALQQSGYRSMADLRSHPRWGSEAERVQGCIDAGQLNDLHGLVRRWFPVSHPLSLSLLGLTDPDRLVIVDLESLGLFGRPVVLIGQAQLDGDGLDVRQLLARDVTEELPALGTALERMGNDPVLVTYNGRAFDANMLRERLDYYGFFIDFEPIHLDLLPHARRHFNGTVPDATLESVETRLGRSREIDLPSALVPDFYNAYAETDNVGPLVPILEHNKHDIVTLAVLLARLLAEHAPQPSGHAA